MTRKEETIKPSHMYFIWSVLFMALCVLGMGQFGVVGVLLYRCMSVFVGVYAAAAYVFLCILMILWWVRKKFKLSWKHWVAISLYIFAFFLYASRNHIFGIEGIKVYWDHIPMIFKDPTYHPQSGLLGALVYGLMSYLVGTQGVYVVIVASVVVGTSFIVNLSTLSRWFSKLKLPERKKKDKKEKKKQEKSVETESFVSELVVEPVEKATFMNVDMNKSVPTPVQTQAQEVPVVPKKGGPYKKPPLSTLDTVQKKAKSNANNAVAKEKGQRLIEVLKQFGIEATLITTHIGPAVTKFEIKPDSNVRITKIASIQDNLMMELAVKTLRIEAPIPGKSAVGIEIPNVEMIPVRMREIFEATPDIMTSKDLPVILGKDLMGHAVVASLNKMPHLLVAGATGSGKSVSMNVIITSLLLTKRPDELQLLLIDPKKVEFTQYEKIPHLIGPVISNPVEAAGALTKIVEKMDERYELFSKKGVRNIEGYNELLTGDETPMPWVVVIIDELADLMSVAGKDVESSIQRITQLARAAGIHLIVATQRPSVDVVTGIIKANIPSRIAFAVSSAVDSRTILDQSGAEKLLGYGDMLYVPMGEPHAIRVQGAYVSDAEVERIVMYASAQMSPQFDDEFVLIENAISGQGGASSRDPLYQDAIDVVVAEQTASTSFLQRRLGIGYNRAANLIDALEEQGIVGPARGSKPRHVILKPDTEDEEA